MSPMQKRNKRKDNSLFPIAFLGIISTTFITCGILYPANRSFSALLISMAPQLPFLPSAPGFKITTAPTFCPQFPLGTATTAASSISGRERSSRSTSKAETFSPPDFIISALLRPRMKYIGPEHHSGLEVELVEGVGGEGIERRTA